MLKVDFHLHTAEDPVDRITHSATDLVAHAASLGYGALAITPHDGQFSDPRVRAYARDLGIVLVPGIERTVEGSHVLLLNFPDTAVESVRTFEDVTRLKAQHDGVVIAPHPFFPDTTCLRSDLARHADLFDGVEWSYFWTHGINFNTRAARWAEAHGKPILGNSDLHDLRQLGRTFSLIDAEPDPAAICDAIRHGRVVMRTQPVPIPELVQVFGGMTVRGRKRRIMGHDSRSRAVARPGVAA